MTKAPRRQLAIFDLDGTLLPDRSAERLLLGRLLRQGALSPSAMALQALGVARALPRNGRGALRSVKRYLSGLPRTELEAHARLCVEEQVLPSLAASGLREMKRQRAAGRQIVLLSGTLQPLLDEVAAHLEVGVALGTRLATDDRGLLTGELAGAHPFGQRKVEVMEHHVRGADVDLAGSWAYADTSADFALLRWVGEGVVVNPSPRLARRARQRGLGAAWWSVGPAGAPSRA